MARDPNFYTPRAAPESILRGRRARRYGDMVRPENVAWRLRWARRALLLTFLVVWAAGGWPGWMMAAKFAAGLGIIYLAIEVHYEAAR